MNNSAIRTKAKGVWLISAAAVLIHPSHGMGAASDSNDVPCLKDTHTYKMVGKHEIKADVYRYPGEDIRPAVLKIHGGGLMLGSRTWIPAEALPYYLDAGFAVISIDYQLAPETKLAAILEDLEDAYAWIRAKGPGLFRIDPDRIAVVGDSAGSYLALVAGFRLEPRPKALVSFYGPADITGPLFSLPDSFFTQEEEAVSREQVFACVGEDTISSLVPADPSWEERLRLNLYCLRRGLVLKVWSGHDPEKEPQWFSRYNPIANVSSAYPPTVLLHGRADALVPIHQSVLMAEALKRHQVDHELIVRHDWGHGFDIKGLGDGLDSPSVREAYRRVIAFLDKHVKP